MNDSTPLLGQVIGHIPPTDSDLFIQIVESPWTCISGRALFFIRSFLAIAMTLILTVYLTLEILAGRSKILIFRLMNLAWTGQCIYMWLTSVSPTELRPSHLSHTGSNAPVLDVPLYHIRRPVPSSIRVYVPPAQVLLYQCFTFHRSRRLLGVPLPSNHLS